MYVVDGVSSARGWPGLEDSAPRRTMLSSSGRSASQFLPRTTVFLELEAAVITSSTAPLVDQLYNAFLIGSPSAFFPV